MTDDRGDGPSWRARLGSTWRQVEEAARAAAERGREVAQGATERGREAARIASDKGREVAMGASERGRELARGAAERLERARRDLEELLSAVDRAGRASARGEALDAARTAFEKAAPHLDLLADAVAVGFLREAGAGLATLEGVELVLVPSDGPVRARLRVSQVMGRSARLAIGGQVGGYVAALYGARELLVQPLERRGADAGLLVASIGLFQAAPSRRAVSGAVDPRRAGGWLVELAAGASLGIPLLSDLSAFESEEIVLASYSLEPQEAEMLEAPLAGAPDRPQRRKLAILLARDAEVKPG